MHVVEGQPDRVIPDRQDFENHHVALAWNRLALVGRMALHLRAWAFDPKILGG